MAIYNVTHSSDLDGMASAAMLMHYYKIPVTNVFFTNYTGKIFEGAAKNIADVPGKGNVIVISDFGMPAENMGKMKRALTAAKKKGNYVMWFDHHPWTDAGIKTLEKVCDIMVVGENPINCGAELVYKFLCKKDRFGDRLAFLTHLADFNLFNKKDDRWVKDVGYAIKYYGEDTTDNKNLRKICALLAVGKFSDKFILDAAKGYVTNSRIYLKELLKSVKIINVNGIKIAIGFSKRLQNQEACMAMLDNLKIHMAIYISYESGHSSIRCIPPVNCDKLAVALGGGGHPLAAGFSLENEVKNFNDDKKQKITSRIISLAEKIYA